MDEWVDILDEAGMPTGKTALKSEAHKMGWYHPTVHIWCYSKDHRVLLQRRGALKRTFPNLWDVSVAGHMAAGESPTSAALREVKEEIGLAIRPEELHKIGIFKCIQHHENGIVDAEFHHTFLMCLDPDGIELIPQEEEVDSLHWFTLGRLIAEVEDPNLNSNHVPHDPEYFKTVIAGIRSAVQPGP